ncbi:UPF0175 family protein [Limnothrix redekei LRLZ20PSL1]|uniref:UPF0175 family protein n=1 Tax=Limnothrix redekei LRLZ20PSL1 TaxID=3112953 RepID=A0ABW7CB44_9CYAN
MYSRKIYAAAIALLQTKIIHSQKLLANRGICVHYDVEDLEQDVQHLRDRGWR